DLDARMVKDLETAKKAPYDSPEYHQAIARLGDVLKLNHGDPPRDVATMGETKFADFAKAAEDVYSKADQKAPDSKGAKVISLADRKKGQEVGKADDNVDADAAKTKGAVVDPQSLKGRLQNPGPKTLEVSLVPLEGAAKKVETVDKGLAAEMRKDMETLK